jgi:hypothetical protein
MGLRSDDEYAPTVTWADVLAVRVAEAYVAWLDQPSPEAESRLASATTEYRKEKKKR